MILSILVPHFLVLVPPSKLGVLATILISAFNGIALYENFRALSISLLVSFKALKISGCEGFSVLFSNVYFFATVEHDNDIVKCSVFV